MIGLLQRVSEARVVVDRATIGQIGRGMLVLVCAERGDTSREADALLNKLLSMRVFSDGEGKMNLNLAQVEGGLLLVPQFTLAADTRSGTRPSFTPAAPPALASELFDYTVQRAREAHPQVETGRFGADMQVALVNDGPVTFWVHLPPSS